MSTFFAAIADDFTGATDLAAMIARSKVPVSLRLGVPEAPPAKPAAVEVIALKCRSTPVAEAVAETGAALDWLRKAGARRVYWKYCSTFDSTAEGNIGPVAEALMAALGTEMTVHVPAFPENGRSVYMGHLFVGRQLLSESPMKDHPLNPMRDSDLERLLAPQIGGGTALVPFPVVAGGAGLVERALHDAEKPGTKVHAVIDTVRDADLGVIAEATAELPLTCGGSALGGALAAEYVARGELAPAPPEDRPDAPPGGILALSGSCSAMTRAQVARYGETAEVFRLDPLALAEGPEMLEEAAAWLKAQDPAAPKLVSATAAPEEVARAQEVLGAAKAGAVVEEALAVLARLGLDQGIRRFAVAGGESSGAVAQALGVTRLDIGPEIAPGVPWCFARSGGQRVALALKSGNFGDADFFATAFRQLERDDQRRR